MAPRRIGWLALAAVSVLAGVASLLGGVWQLGLAVADGNFGDAVAALAGAALSVVFWRWIGLGAWERAHPVLDPETGEPLAPTEPIGPWGWVGRALLAVILVAFVGGGAWATIAGNRDQRQAADLQARVERTAKRADLTIDRIDAVASAHQIWLMTHDGDPDRSGDPLAALLEVPGTTVQDASAEDDRAAILLRPDDGLPCIVVDLDVDELVSTRQTSRC